MYLLLGLTIDDRYILAISLNPLCKERVKPSKWLPLDSVDNKLVSEAHVDWLSINEGFCSWPFGI